MPPKYNLDKIKFSTDAPTFEKSVALYENGKVTQFKEGISAYSAVVVGTKPYHASVEARRYDYGHCECYLGQKDMLCKHMVAVAIMAVTGGRPLTKEEKQITTSVTCSGKLGMLTSEELLKTKKTITDAVKYIKSYSGPSRTWFSYQNSLSESCNRLAKIVSDLPVSEQTAQLMVDLLLRIDKKLGWGGVDDSDGTVGGFIDETVAVLAEYAKIDSSCINAFQKLKGKETSFGWEESLLKLIEK